MNLRRLLPRAVLAAGLVAGGLLAAGLATAGPARAADAAPVDREIAVSLDPESREIQVVDRFAAEAERALTFALAPWMAVAEARVDGRTVEPRRVGDRVVLRYPAPGRREVALRLEGVVPPLPEPDRRGRVSGAVAGPEGSYLPGYGGWLPILHGRMTYRLTLDVPAGQRAVATGRLVSDGVEGARYRAAFEAAQPGEAPSVFAGPFAVTERRLSLGPEGEIRLRTYFHRDLAPLAAGYLQASANYIKAFAERIGPYPYADFHVISAPLPVGLGFPNLTYVSRQIVPLPFMRGRSLAHEVLHNWWGNGVAVDYAAGNWSEGLTTYMADYALAERKGPAAAAEMRLGWLRSLSALTGGRATPVLSFVSKAHDAGQAIGYDKAAFLFHQLRRELGDQAFDAGLQEFWRRERFKTAGWADLQRAFEQAAGRDLGWFFDQWLTRPGLPELTLAAAERQGAGEGDDGGYGGGFAVTVTLRQADPAYRLRVPIVVETAEGTKEFEVVLSGRQATFTLPVAAEPRALAVDPGFDLLRRLLPGESAPIVRDVTLAAETRVLVLTGDPAAAETAGRLAGRLLQRRYERVEAADAAKAASAAAPLLVIGTTPEIAAFRANGAGAADKDGPGDTLAGKGTARAWTERGPAGQPRLIVQADDAAALEALLRPLPHYRSRGFLVFDGSKAVETGVWPAPASPLAWRF